MISRCCGLLQKLIYKGRRGGGGAAGLRGWYLSGIKLLSHTTSIKRLVFLTAFFSPAARFFILLFPYAEHISLVRLGDKVKLPLRLLRKRNVNVLASKDTDFWDE